MLESSPRESKARRYLRLRPRRSATSPRAPVLKFGARPIDAAVLLAAFQRGAHKRAHGGTVREYAARLAAQRDLDLQLRPIVSLLKGDA
jgi:hypothetical protein